MAKSKKSKVKALPHVPQDREGAVFAVGRIGSLRRQIAACQAKADEKVRIAGEELEQEVAPLAEELGQHESGLHVYCEANRLKLTNDFKVKYHDFGTGRVNWRQRPPKVSIKGVETVIEACKKLGLQAFLSEKTEINKNAMLADQDKARTIAGVTISSEGEDFVIEPAELETAQPVKA